MNVAARLYKKGLSSEANHMKGLKPEIKHLNIHSYALKAKLNTLSQILEAMGRHQEALDQLQKVAVSQPAEPLVHKMMSKVR